MAEYIFVTKKGEVVAKRNKGRGRTRPDAIERESGKWYVVVASKDDIDVKRQDAPIKKEYIYVDGNKELRREPKGRGRVKTGAIEREPGKWYIDVSAPPKLPPLKTKHEPSLEADVDVPVVDTPEPEKRPVRRKVTTQITLKEFMRCCNPVRISKGNGRRVMEGVYMIGDCHLEGIKVDGVYNRVIVDENENTITFIVLPKHTPIAFVGALKPNDT